eukprot:UC4_evm1s379
MIGRFSFPTTLGILSIYFHHLALFSTALNIDVDWKLCPVTRSTAASVLVAADPEWIEEGPGGGILSKTAQEGVESLARAGANNIRLLNFNIFPLASCAQIVEGVWNFTLMDKVVIPFLDATLIESGKVIIDIETSPQWMWEDAGACKPLSPNDDSCAPANKTPDGRSNATCADGSSISLPPGDRTRCPHWGDTHIPRDRSWREIAVYFSRVAQWYTRGGFVDERGIHHYSGHYYDEKRIIWEIWNEINLGREHNVSIEDYVALYDAQVSAMKNLPGGAWKGEFGGPSLCGLNRNASARHFFTNFFNKSNHVINAATFHQYAVCKNNTPAGLENIFPSTVHQLSALQTIDDIRKELRPNTSLHLTESGIVCNSPFWCDGNNYSCYYKTFDRSYWVASATQWIYQFFLSSHIVNLATIVQSQILGFPAGYDGLSGEWPCGTMVDWEEKKLNHKYWIMIALLKVINTNSFSFCATEYIGKENHYPSKSFPENSSIYAQGIRSSKGKILVLINTKSTEEKVLVYNAKGKNATIIDGEVGNEPARDVKLATDEISLSPFATIFLQF